MIRGEQTLRNLGRSFAVRHRCTGNGALTRPSSQWAQPEGGGALCKCGGCGTAKVASNAALYSNRISAPRIIRFANWISSIQILSSSSHGSQQWLILTRWQKRVKWAFCAKKLPRKNVGQQTRVNEARETDNGEGRKVTYWDNAQDNFQSHITQSRVSSGRHFLALCGYFFVRSLCRVMHEKMEHSCE